MALTIHTSLIRMSKLEAKGVGNLATRLADKLGAVSSLIEQERCSTDRVGNDERRGTANDTPES